MFATLENYKCSKGPETAYYIPDFINCQEEFFLLKHINNAPKSRWTNLSKRRLQMWGGVPHAKGMIPEPLPQWLIEVINKIEHCGFVSDCKVPNHALINEYLPGQGILAHFDGDLYHPVIFTVSLGSHTVLRFHDQDNGIPFKLWLEPGSLVILKDDLYGQYKHSIDEVPLDAADMDTIINAEFLKTRIVPNKVYERGIRVSITLRHIEKTSKFKLNLFHK